MLKNPLKYLRKFLEWTLLMAFFGINSPALGTPDSVVLRLWNIPQKGSSHPLEMARRKTFEAFCRKYPDIQVKVLVPMKIEGPAAEGNEFLAVAGGVAPDVFYLYGRKIGDYYSQGFLEPLDSYLAEYQRRSGNLYRGINAPSPVWELCQINHRIYCVPYLYYSLALMCRKDLFSKSGIPLDPLEDWEGLYKTARRLTWFPDKEPEGRPGDTPIVGLGMMTGLYAGWHMQQYIWSSGGQVVRSYYPTSRSSLVEVPAPPIDYRKWFISISDAERYYPKIEDARIRLKKLGINPDYSMTDLQWKLDINNPQGEAVLEFYRRLIHTKWMRCENRHSNREFDLTAAMLKDGIAECPVCRQKTDISNSKGKKRIYTGVVQEESQTTSRNLRYEIAMQINVLEEISDPTQIMNLAILPFPSRTRDIPPAAFMAGHYLAINVTQKDPRVRAAAWKYIEFMTGEEAQKIRVQTFVDNGLAEFIRPASLKALGYDVELEGIPKSRRVLWDDLEKYARVEPYCRGFQHVITHELGIPIEGIINDKPDEAGRFHRDPRQMLAETCRRVNTMILGKLPQEVIQRREKAGWIIGAFVLALLGLGTYTTIRLAVKMHNTASDLEGLGIRGKTGRRTLVTLLFLAPAVATILLWGYYPLLRGTVMAFQDFKILGDSKFVGLANFIQAVSAPEFWRYLLQTFVFLVLNLGMGFFAPIALAIFLTEVPKGKVLFRTIYYLPAVTTGIVTLFLWKQLLYDPAPTGLINGILLYFNDLPPGVMIFLKVLIVCFLVFSIMGLGRVGLNRGASLCERMIPLGLALAAMAYLIWQMMDICQGKSVLALVQWFATSWSLKPQGFLRDPQLAMFWIVVPMVWAGMGPGCLIYLAALKGIPDEQYEAADLDGAGLWSKIVNIVYPNLSALILINLVGAVIGAVQSSSNIFVMTGGGPEDATMTVGLSIWFNAYMFLNFGLATSQAWVLGAMLIGFTLYQLRLLNKMQFRSTVSGR
jgi:ABC-type sugar transport system permease subunit/ABC-type glycerol-3-phosphate transport system substrate-binding protein